MHPYDNTETLLRVLREPRRNNYFYGKRMDVQHFQMEQDYGKLKQWLLNRLTLGKGVLCGLRVTVDDGKLCVDPGVAIDGLGREIIVPVRSCIDPVTQEGGCCNDPCCGEHGATPEVPVGGTDVTPVPTAAGLTPSMVTPVPVGTHANVRGDAAPAAADLATPSAASGIFTLWACYRECKAEYQPVLVSDCGTREQCAAGTIVESFCLKVTPGLPPLQGDLEWCAKLWLKPKDPGGRPPTTRDMTPGIEPHGLVEPGHADLSNLIRAAPNLGGTDAHVPTDERAKTAWTSRRRILCELFSGKCDPPEGDPCVPLAVMLLRDKRVERFDSCVVRPRVYSNAVLLDLILCLAEKIDECCGDEVPPKPVDPMHVASVEFLGGPNNQNVIATVQSPLAPTLVPIGKQGNAIRVRFTKPFDTGANAPTTPGLNDPNWKRHNVLVLPEQGGPAAGAVYAPGTLTIEAPDTILWELSKESPFWSRQHKGWQKGQLRLAICGDADAGVARPALADTAGSALDGEPIAPALGVISGDGTKGGNFTLVFNVG